MTGKAGVAIATSGLGVSNLVGPRPRIPSIAAGQAPAAVRSYHLLSVPRWSFTNCSKEIAGRPSSRGTASTTDAATSRASVLAISGNRPHHSNVAKLLWSACPGSRPGLSFRSEVERLAHIDSAVDELGPGGLDIGHDSFFESEVGESWNDVEFCSDTESVSGDSRSGGGSTPDRTIKPSNRNLSLP